MLNQGGDQGGVLVVFTVSQAINAAFGQQLAAGDLDADGDVDLLARFDTTQVWWNDGSASFTRGPDLDIGSEDFAIGDLDNDGQEDIVAGGRNLVGGSVVVWNNGDQTFTLDAFAPDPNDMPHDDAALGDLDGDSDLAVYILARFTNSSKTGIVLLNNGTAPSPPPMTISPASKALAMKATGPPWPTLTATLIWMSSWRSGVPTRSGLTRASPPNRINSSIPVSNSARAAMMTSIWTPALQALAAGDGADPAGAAKRGPARPTSGRRQPAATPIAGQPAHRPRPSLRRR